VIIPILILFLGSCWLKLHLSSGELNLASELFLDLAKQTDSALLAERATRLTTYTRKWDNCLGSLQNLE